MSKFHLQGHEIEVSKDGQKAVVRKVLSRRQIRKEQNRVAPEVLYEAVSEVVSKDGKQVGFISAQVKAIRWVKSAGKASSMQKSLQEPKQTQKPEVKP
jgi:hypothetical protein